MWVVARLNCNSVEQFVTMKTAKFSPVITSQDPHDEEIKKFFAATPAGQVMLTVDDADELPFRPGDQVYLTLASDDTPSAVKVTSVKLQGWATIVEMETPYEARPRLVASFTIRNEAAAEQFQVGTTLKFQLVPVRAS